MVRALPFRLSFSYPLLGPYDEIIWVPGLFAVPPTGRKAMRATRIYVSNKESLYNGALDSIHPTYSFLTSKSGRKNWNIPKNLAHFVFTPGADTSSKALPYSRISVAPHDSPETPFFVIDLSPTMFLSDGIIPFSTHLFPTSLLQTVNPPLPQSLNWKEDGRVGTETWLAFTSGMKGKAGFFRGAGGLPGGAFGNGIDFPDVKPWSLGMWVREFELNFPIPEVLGKKDQ